MATQLMRQEDARNPFDQLRNQLEKRADEFKMALPSHISPEKFQRVVLTAAQSNPDILAADRRSLITACMKCAQDGLVPDGREAALVIYTNSVKDANGRWEKVKVVQYLPMVYGLRKKIIQSGQIRDITAKVVYRAEYEKGLFVYEEGEQSTVRHRPALDLEDADATDDNIVAAYSVVTYMDGFKSYEVMTRAEINKVRQASQTGAVGKTKFNGQAIEPKGPWVDWFGEMAKKTVMRRHAKTLPMSSDLVDVEGNEQMAAESAVRLLASEEEAPRIAATPPTRAEIADRSHEAAPDDEQEPDAPSYDPETGEIAAPESDEETTSPQPSDTAPLPQSVNGDAAGSANPDAGAEDASNNTWAADAQDLIDAFNTCDTVAALADTIKRNKARLNAIKDESIRGAIEKSYEQNSARLSGGKK